MEISLYQIISFSIILIFSLILSVQDIKKMSVRLYIQWLSVLCALVCHFIFNRKELWLYLLCSLVMGSFYFLVRKITKNKLGPADVCFGFFQGLFLTPLFLPVCLGAEALAALVFIAINKSSTRKPFAFIPFMSIGLLTAFILHFFFQDTFLL